MAFVSSARMKWEKRIKRGDLANRREKKEVGRREVTASGSASARGRTQINTARQKQDYYTSFFYAKEGCDSRN